MLQWRVLAGVRRKWSKCFVAHVQRREGREVTRHELLYFTGLSIGRLEGILVFVGLLRTGRAGWDSDMVLFCDVGCVEVRVTLENPWLIIQTWHVGLDLLLVFVNEQSPYQLRDCLGCNLVTHARVEEHL